VTENILVIGANGQIGSELTAALRQSHGNVIATDIAPAGSSQAEADFEQLDVLDEARLEQLVADRRVTTIYHMAALLSATGEKNPMKAWHLNMNGLLNVLNICVNHKVRKLFWPSSIAAFGPDVPLDHTPQHVPMNPTSIYGITKVAGEQLCAWYHRKHGLDVRSLRYPGLVSFKTMPGGGTTDYSVEIFHAALSTQKYTCFLGPDTRLPFMYMDDAIRGTFELMNADASRLTIRTSYNFTAFSMSPSDLAAEIMKHIPEFTITYKPDYRQQLADSWPRGIDDSDARKDWDWKPRFDLVLLVEDMLKHLAVPSQE
jgi:nucleoside-diphosphate-sugar epimerase